MDVAPKEATDEVDKFPVPERCWNRAEKLSEETALSRQESEIAALMIFGYSKDDITNALDISDSHYETIVYDRIPEKVKQSRQTIESNLKHSPLGAHLQNALSDTEESRIVGCTGPNCDNNVETNTNNPLFDNYYSKTINQHADERRMMNSVTYHFCSAECLVEYNRKI